MSASPMETALQDLRDLVDELRAKDDKLVRSGELEPLDEKQARRIGVYRPTLTLIQGGRDA